MRPGQREQTIHRIEQAAGRLATQSVARMDEQLAWFRALPADQRSWVTLVAQAGIASFVEWLRSPDDILRLTGDVFAAAPRAMARSVSLQQTVELVQQTIQVAEEQVPELADPDDQAALREELLRFSREIAFASARVYARAAESRGAWDDRLEALVLDALIRGDSTIDTASQFAALGWRTGRPVTAVIGRAPKDEQPELRAETHRVARRCGYDVLAGVHGGQLIALVGGAPDAATAAARLLGLFGDGPVVVAPAVPDVSGANDVIRAALSGLRAASAWLAAPRPVSTDALLPERALAGDLSARDELIANIYRPLAGEDVLLETVTAFLASGAALEATARALFVHANTVRYRLRRVSEVCGESPTNPRGAFVLGIALTLGRLADGTP
jgi:hypothetical protein